MAPITVEIEDLMFEVVVLFYQKATQPVTTGPAEECHEGDDGALEWEVSKDQPFREFIQEAVLYNGKWEEDVDDQVYSALQDYDDD